MSRASRRAKLEKQLVVLESEFRRDLITALRRCQQGEFGIFGRHDRFEESRWLPLSAVGLDLVERGDRIASVRRDIGLPESDLLARFKAHRASDGSNSPADSKLADRLLHEIEDELPVESHRDASES